VILIVAGVSGSGKTTVGERLGRRLGWPFADADSFHPASNVAKMHAGIPLTDEDRMPWLGAITAWMDERIAAGQDAVVSCSALRRSYRSLLLSGRPDAVMVFLRVDRDELRTRLATRAGHFFKPELLDSQLATLEPPAPDESVLWVPSEPDPDETVNRVIETLTASGHTLDT
jgi:gluconokinase